MDCKKVCGYVTTGMFVAVIAGFLILILGQFVIKNVFIEILGMENAITDLSVTGGSDGMIDVDWAALYPFEEQVDINVGQNSAKSNFLIDKVRKIVNIIDMYSNDYLPFKEEIKIPSGLFDKLIDNRMIDTDNIYMKVGTDGMIIRSPFYQSFTDEQLDTSALADNVEELQNFLTEQEIDFLYVQSPIKEDKYDNGYVEQYGLSYENRLADNLLAELALRDIDVLDLREALHEEKGECYDGFFHTDNHWNIETALWATRTIAQKLNEDYGFRFDLEYFDEANYNKNIYEDWIFGTIGRSVTLANAGYDDITVFEPKFETSLTMKIPDLNMDKTGNFLETMINPVPFKRRSVVYHNAYDAFAYSKPPVTEVTNNTDTGNNEKSVLLIRESFAGPVIAYMSLGIGNLYAVTPEGFTGSIESYIKQTQPDMVVILYTAPPTNEVTSKYDFR